MPRKPLSEILKEYEQRNERIRKLRAQGYSFGQIAEHFKISRQRVEQICKPAHAHG